MKSLSPFSYAEGRGGKGENEVLFSPARPRPPALSLQRRPLSRTPAVLSIPHARAPSAGKEGGTCPHGIARSEQQLVVQDKVQQGERERAKKMLFTNDESLVELSVAPAKPLSQLIRFIFGEPVTLL